MHLATVVTQATPRTMSDQNQDGRTSDPAESTSETVGPEMSRRGVLAGTAGLGLLTKYDPRNAPNNADPPESNPVDIGSRLELFVDDYLIDVLDGVEQRLHPPEPQEVVIEHDEPWEGGGSGYHTVFKDDDKYRMYYKSWNIGIGIPESGHRLVTGYAESDDGIHWEKPNLGLFEFDGSTNNNIVWDGMGDPSAGSHNFTVFKDENPDADPDARYKALGGLPSMGFKSPDGIHWEKIQEEPVLPDSEGAYDSQNLAFWDPVEEEYRAYFRSFSSGQRIIRTARSDDFVNWGGFTDLEYPDAPPEQLYINAIKPYHRAPHIKLGFPARYIERDWDSQSMRELPGWDFRQKRASASLRYGAAVTDTLFMSSRGNMTFSRWPRAFIRPGLWDDDSHSSWKYGDNYTAWQVVETESTEPDKPRELSLYATERYWTSDARLRRYTLRLDGFVSMQAPLDGGEFVTHPVKLEGEDLALNYSTSAAGSIRVELQNPAGQPIKGFTLEDSPDIFGDDLQRTVQWQSDRELADLKDEDGEYPPVRLRFELSDADLYSFQFG